MSKKIWKSPTFTSNPPKINSRIALKYSNIVCMKYEIGAYTLFSTIFLIDFCIGIYKCMCMKKK